MDPNTNYYSQNARSFFESTAFVDMSVLHDVFLSKLSANAQILDTGCGSGRDAKAFADRGFKVSAFDASPELALLASQHCGFKVGVRTLGMSQRSRPTTGSGVVPACSMCPRPNYRPASCDCGGRCAQADVST